MLVVIVSKEYQVEIPREIRESLDIRPGEEVQVFQHENRIELVPVRKIEELRGMIKGVKEKFEREDDRL